MIELMITISVKTNDPNYHYDIEDIPLTLETLAPITSIKATSMSWGRWYCESPYLGKGFWGPYFVRMNQQSAIGNPWGYFCDWQEEKYTFLYLAPLIPMTMKKDAHGDSEITDTRATHLHWRYVKWRRVK